MMMGAATSVIFVIFVATNVLSQQTRLLSWKNKYLSGQTRVCRDKSFVATNTCLSGQKYVVCRDKKKKKKKFFLCQLPPIIPWLPVDIIMAGADTSIIFVATNTSFHDKHIYVATKHVLSRQKYVVCRDRK